MADVKQILVVDDHFEILEFLRSMLELSDSSYQVLGVPSAEEAFLELQRLRYDLLITDLRLPGMSGLDLLARVRPIQSQLPIIVITAYTNARDRRDAERLGVQGYFQKPLDVEAFMSSVRLTLSGHERSPREATGSSGDASPTNRSDAGDIGLRMQTLQDITGASHAALATMAGDVLFPSDYQASQLAQLIKLAVMSLQNSLQMATLLGDVSKAMLLHQSGRRVDIHMANVGNEHCLVLLIRRRPEAKTLQDVQAGIRSAVDDLTSVLHEQAPSGKDDKEMTPVAGRASPVFDPKQAEELRLLMESPDETTQGTLPADAGLGDAIPQTEREAIFDLLNSFLEQEQAELDVFWETALAKDTGVSGDGLSFDEAQRRGLIPPQLDSQQDE